VYPSFKCLCGPRRPKALLQLGGCGWAAVAGLLWLARLVARPDRSWRVLARCGTGFSSRSFLLEALEAFAPGFAPYGVEKLGLARRGTVRHGTRFSSRSFLLEALEAFAVGFAPYDVEKLLEAFF